MGASSSDACIPCPAGTANPIPGSSGASACAPCLPGSHASDVGFAVCALCKPGTFQDEAGASACKICRGGYCPGGSKGPTSCEVGGGLAHATVAIQGATDRSACVCQPTFYDNATDGLVQCLPCPSGSECDQAGTALMDLPITRGYYRRSQNSVDVRRCPGWLAIATDSTPLQPLPLLCCSVLPAALC